MLSQKHDFFLNFCNNLLAITRHLEEPNEALRRYDVKKDVILKKGDSSSIFLMRE